MITSLRCLSELLRGGGATDIGIYLGSLHFQNIYLENAKLLELK